MNDGGEYLYSSMSRHYPIVCICEQSSQVISQWVCMWPVGQPNHTHTVKDKKFLSREKERKRFSHHRTTMKALEGDTE